MNEGQRKVIKVIIIIMNNNYFHRFPKRYKLRLKVFDTHLISDQHLFYLIFNIKIETICITLN